jgi:hypothetical protein
MARSILGEAKRIMEMRDLIAMINGKEPEGILRTLAMMAYNPAIGRVLEKGAVDRFADLMVQTVPKFYGLVSRGRFDEVHAEACEQILMLFKTNRGNTLSYGQAQKPLNVFLKVYVDWARQPSKELADRLTPLLHVPLDSLLMGFIAREFTEQYGSLIAPIRKRLACLISQRMKAAEKNVERMLLSDEFSLVGLNREMYQAWQELLRRLYPAKPVALDLIWVSERSRLRAGVLQAAAGE